MRTPVAWVLRSHGTRARQVELAQQPSVDGIGGRDLTSRSPRRTGGIVAKRPSSTRRFLVKASFSGREMACR